jgi:hypothetical protein
MFIRFSEKLSIKIESIISGFKILKIHFLHYNYIINLLGKNIKVKAIGWQCL